jgi:hypothetical protein
MTNQPIQDAERDLISDLEIEVAALLESKKVLMTNNDGDAATRAALMVIGTIHNAKLRVLMNRKAKP